MLSGAYVINLYKLVPLSTAADNPNLITVAKIISPVITIHTANTEAL